MTDDDLVELRGVSGDEDPALEHIWIADQPLGKLLDAQQQRIKDLESENEQLREELVELDAKLDEAKQTAASALGVARATDDGARADGSPAKVDQARWNARNKLVKEALVGNATSITVPEVQRMCEPELDVAYQTVKDAFSALQSRWTAFEMTNNADGSRVLTVTVSALSEDVVAAVEADLERDDLTKRLISRRGGDGSA
jgi:cell division septum initiation protein DivIVA